MPGIEFVFCLLLIAVTGYAVALAIDGACRLPLCLMLGLCWTLGAGAIPLVLFILSLAGHVPDRAILYWIGGGDVVAICAFAWFGRLARTRCWPTARRSTLDLIISVTSIGLVFIAAANVLAEARVSGISDIDGFGIWVLKAKIVVHVPLRPIPVWLTDPALSYSHQDYPLNVPLLTAAVHAATGWSPATSAKALLMPNFLALVAVMVGGITLVLQCTTQSPAVPACPLQWSTEFLRSSKSPRIGPTRSLKHALPFDSPGSSPTWHRLTPGPLALALTAIFCGAPLMILLAGSPEAETPLLLFHAATLWMLAAWMLTEKRALLMLAAVLAAFTAMTKNEGLALLPLLGLAIVAFSILRRSRALLLDAIWASLLAVAVALPWLIYRTYLPRTHEDYGDRLPHVISALQTSGRLGMIARQFLRQPFELSSVGLIWIILIIVAAVRWRALCQPALLVMWGILILHVLLYVMVFVVTPWKLATLLPMVSPKLMMHVSPAAVVLIALYLRRDGDDT